MTDNARAGSLGVINHMSFCCIGSVFPAGTVGLGQALILPAIKHNGIIEEIPGHCKHIYINVSRRRTQVSHHLRGSSSVSEVRVESS